MGLTSLTRNLFASRWRQLERYTNDSEELQRQVLARLINQGRQTEYGRSHHFDSLRSYDDFVQRVPLNDYDALKADIDRMRRGERDVLWPGRVKWYAKSSGTTNDKSKFIPVSADGLKSIHYRGGTDAVAIYLRNNPQSRMFDGKGLILGGSHAPNYNLPGSLVGDLSAILIENINPLVNLIRIPKKETALLADFEVKRDRIAREAMTKNVTNLSGVPSWMLSVLNRVMELSGKTHLEEVWPNLEVFFHGGVAFTPYREQYEHLITSPLMHYEETYNASEGFFGVQDDPNDKSLLLMVDYDVFFEFQELKPNSPREGNLGSSAADNSAVNSNQTPLPTGGAGGGLIPLWAVEPGKNYAMVITTSCGLWRYMIGDTIQFTSVNPYKFIITGRTKHFINAFGEELIVDNAEQGLGFACKQTGAEVLEYTAAPVFMDRNAKCRHQWLIEFSQPPADLQLFARLLDQKLKEINSDYEAKRHKDITLQPLEIIVARPNLFNDWLKTKGHLGGQHKVPRLSNSRETIEQLLQLNNQ
ncbi:MAG: GH3 auxin-responsive promoter family protein [Prevotella sp.]|nr:GH3 auxin-responsive promoter family protein [Prevotella sp.]